MKRIFSIASLVAAFAATPLAFANEDSACHFHGNKPASEATVVGCATQYKDGLVTNGKLDKSWQTVKLEKAEIVEGVKGKEWKVTFKDLAAKNKAKETLYLFFTLPGNFIAANFTGK